MATPAGIFKVSRPEKHYIEYDEFESFIVACRDAFVARRTHPRSTPEELDEGFAPRWCASKEAWVGYDNEPQFYHAWTTFINELVVERVGDATPGQLGVIHSNFRAG